MATHRQIIVQINPTTRGLGRSDSANLQKVFPASPINNGELNDEIIIANAKVQLIDGAVDDGGHIFGSFDRDYADSPDLTQVETGGGGLPGTPFSPNVASPAEGMNPESIPESGVDATVNAQGAGSPFPGDAFASPKTSTAVISKQTIGTGKLKYGSSEPQG